MDPVVAIVAAYRIAGSLLVLRWPFWGALVAILVDLGDLLLFDLFRVYGGWTGSVDYQAFDKWADQVYLAAFLIVALRDFAPLPRRIAVALFLFRLIGFVAFEVGSAPRAVLFAFPNVFELWFVAVAFTLRFRPTFVWSAARSAAVLAVLLAAKLVQEWTLHVARLFDTTTFLDALDSIRRALTAPFGGG